MPSPPATRLRITRLRPSLAPGTRDPALWAALVHDAWPHARVLSEKPSASVRALPTTGEGATAAGLGPLVAKVEPIDSPQRTIQALLGHTPLDRHWRGAVLLERAGIRTAAPQALFDGLSADARRTQCLVMEHLAGPSLLTLLAEHHARALSPEHRARIARAVARLVFRLHARGLINRDPKPSNLIVLDAHAPSPEIAVVDCIGVRAGRAWEATRSARDRRLARTLASLVIEPIGTERPPARTDRMRTLRELARLLDAERSPSAQQPPPGRVARDLWRRAARIVADHADPRPAHDPLAPAVRPPGSGGGDARTPMD
jgi:hypothetical protein